MRTTREQMLYQIRSRLQAVRKDVGEEAFKVNARIIAAQLKSYGGEMADVAREVFKDDGFDFDVLTTPLPAENSPLAGSLLATDILKLVPGIKTQAQFDAFMAGFKALTLGMQAVFAGDKDGVEKAKTAVLETFDLAVTSTEIAKKLQGVSEAATSEASNAHKEPPREFVEFQTQESLLQELAAISTLADLGTWYKENRARIDRVQTATLRNSLLDQVRKRQGELQELSDIA